MSQYLLKRIDNVSKTIGNTWPLYTFVASNPLAGYETSPFHDAINVAEKEFGAHVFPAPKLYRQAWENGHIDVNILNTLLQDNGFEKSAAHYLELLESQKPIETHNVNQDVDRIMAKWLAAFLDEGLAEWEMPFKTDGFYAAWRLLAIYDSNLGSTSLKEIPKTSEAALKSILKNHSETDYDAIFKYHLAALPGWTGYIKHRQQSHTDWQKAYPINLMDYLAVRLWTTKKLNGSVLPIKIEDAQDDTLFELKHIWLKAWEQSWQQELVNTLEAPSTLVATDDRLPDAQLVFCIDTRSELIRRHVESQGNYETFGYAGFFGIAMDYQNKIDGITRKSCPPIVSSAYKVSETARSETRAQVSNYDKRTEVLKFSAYFKRRMKNMLPSAFGYVEGSGFFYGISLLLRTLFSGKHYQNRQKQGSKMEAIYEPSIKKSLNHDPVETSISIEEKVAIVKSAFDLMGWEQFAPLVLFVGHGSHSQNNPFSSSLDCGACAASPGRHNARMLAKLANDWEVRYALRELHDINITDNTIFVGAEHNTTTDAIEIFDSEVPASHKQWVDDLRVNLLKAQKSATEDRFGTNKKSISLAHYKASNWSETRPEWGLAKNAGFIIGPRNLTKDSNLDGRCFLHSYDWKLDLEGKALEGIMQGPMVVTQWINSHYYFSTVDNNTYGGGSKITHNITGKFGVVQGNGGDLKMGLPLQSLYASDDDMYHQPLRLSVIIEAPVNRVSEILVKNTHLMELLNKEWLYLVVMDPTDDNKTFRYRKSLRWDNISNSTKAAKSKSEVDELISA